MDRFNISGNGPGDEARFIGKHGRQDSEYDNTLAENAEYQPAPTRRVNWWRVLGLIICLIPWTLIAACAFAHYKFSIHSH